MSNGVIGHCHEAHSGKYFDNYVSVNVSIKRIEATIVSLLSMETNNSVSYHITSQFIYGTSL